MSKPTVSYWHVWTDEEGISHQTQCELSDFKQESMGGGADPQWNNRLFNGDTEVLFTVQPVGWVGEWHENPEPQWIVPLSGRWFVETMNGQRVEMGAGEFSFGGDQNTQPNEKGQKGHLSGTVGDEPAVLMVVQLKDKKWLAAQPGDFQ
ncbi:MAG: cupin [Phormidesmis priestleyi]|uniref:Cupin n=1 Tax=Phormidesmis priestleyi TaxID=268141 RepID=A0A2W4XR47_9CYAN|nr:MAG: cupin [Phormidesmis priestleyi]